MRLSWDEIRARAAEFARQWRGEGYERGQTQLFYQAFFEIFGVPVRRVASFERPVRQLGDKRGFIDLFWKGVLLVEQKSAGRDLQRAKTQALDYFPGLQDSELPRYLLLSDFQTFELWDLDEDDAITFNLADLPHHVERFGFIMGVQRRAFRDQDPVNIKASELIGQIHDSIKGCGHLSPDLERLLVQLVFCLFADNTGIFQPRGIFVDFLETRSAEDGTDVGSRFAHLCNVLNTPEDSRSAVLDEDLARFPYVDGDLFSDPMTTPSFDSETRSLLIQACHFDWSKISPAIFGSLFQSVMDRGERRAQGAHYTTEKNILKVIEPLFLDDLRAEFERIRQRSGGGRLATLKAFHRRLGQMTFLDPACGCGNFLVIAYRELRSLEIDVIREIRAFSTIAEQQELYSAGRLRVDVDQCYGIEIGAWPARIAETALWMMDHIMKNRMSLEFGETYACMPLKASSVIAQGDALEMDWAAILRPERCSFVLGNPPFVGAKLQSERQRSQVRRIAALGGSGGTLDYVSAWFIKAAEYTRLGTAKVGFVATNSVTHGEQVGQLWPILLERCGMEISFAHRTFAWGSDARGKAHVHVVIVGLADRAAKAKNGPKRLFAYEDLNGEPGETRHKVLSPYLFDAGRLRNPRMVVHEAPQPLNGLPRIVIGSKPIDGGHYIFTGEQKRALLSREPGAEQWLRPYVGAREFINGGRRWILALHDAPPSELRRMPEVRARIEAVEAYRRKSRAESTRALADTPTLYHVNVLPDRPFLVVPETSSEARRYVPIAWMEPPTIPSNAVRIVKDATLPLFGLLTSAMHMSWLHHIGGRLKSDYRYSIGLVYNTFPPPPGGTRALAKLESPASAVLKARAEHPEASLGDLYHRTSMPVNLRQAHRKLDRAVDRLYRPSGFQSSPARAEHLLALYEDTLAPLSAPNPRGRPRRGTG